MLFYIRRLSDAMSLLHSFLIKPKELYEFTKKGLNPLILDLVQKLLRFLNLES